MGKNNNEEKKKVIKSQEKQCGVALVSELVCGGLKKHKTSNTSRWLQYGILRWEVKNRGYHSSGDR